MCTLKRGVGGGIQSRLPADPDSKLDLRTQTEIMIGVEIKS